MGAASKEVVCRGCSVAGRMLPVVGGAAAWPTKLRTSQKRRFDAVKNGDLVLTKW